MSGGKLVKILLKTRVSRYLEWKCNQYFIFSHRWNLCITKQRSRLFLKRWLENRQGSSHTKGSFIIWPYGNDGKEKMPKVHGSHAKFRGERSKNTRENRYKQASQIDVLKIRFGRKHHWFHWSCRRLICWWKLRQFASYWRDQKDSIVHGLNGQIWKLTFHLPSLRFGRYSRRILKNQCCQRWNIHAQHWH